jgi:hypothetical protein
MDVVNTTPRWPMLRRLYRRYVTGGVFVRSDEVASEEAISYKRGANAMQVGGAHYKSLPIEPWDYIAANRLGFFEGNIVKYITRAARTSNRDDVLKAQHYLSKLLEITPGNDAAARTLRVEPLHAGQTSAEDAAEVPLASGRQA